MLSTTSKTFLITMLRVAREEVFKDRPEAYLEFLQHAEGVIVDAIFATLEALDAQQSGGGTNVPIENNGVQGPGGPT